MRVLFGTDGIRGKAHRCPLDPATVFALGEALAHRLRPRPTILLGMDTRESGPEIANALAAGIAEGGGKAQFIGVVPTPAVAYLCRTSDAAAGISISAAHNPVDGDADRAIFVDDWGNVRDGDEIIYLWAQKLRAEGKLDPPCVVTTVMSNYGFERQLRDEGIELVRAQVGDKYVLEQIQARHAKLGGEQTGHIIDLPVHTTGDGIHTALVFGELLARADRAFSALQTFVPMPQVLLNQEVASKPPLESLPMFQAALAEGERELGGQGRILVRYSGTENKVRVMVEGPDEAATRKIAEHLRIVLRDEIK